MADEQNIVPLIDEQEALQKALLESHEASLTWQNLETEAPQELVFGEVSSEEEEETSKEVAPNQKELGYMRIEELIGNEKLSIETAEWLMLRIGAGEIEIVLKELQSI